MNDKIIELQEIIRKQELEIKLWQKKYNDETIISLNNLRSVKEK
jgi:hypothetical protein